MSNAHRVGWMTVVGVLALLVARTEPFAQSGLPNPYRPVKGLAEPRPRVLRKYVKVR